ncbi:zinc-dependent metalloprotease [Patiriisocius hiemis]|uniref:Zinc-dependent metalloprotease n=1 Tax=Patiriisocius hiemis TaxID=3075604 RepID=A0ABU2YE63_9FLAO|nr:zinc-dependent metalloprotease [Constantimarinum sp. W242]MDT0556471.1 zinc-dependent metalloprotease [Constantimarinum sp. W242]
MIRRLTLCFLLSFFAIALQAQHTQNVLEFVNQQFRNTNQVTSYNLFNSSFEDARTNYATAVEQGVVFDINLEEVSRIFEDNPQVIELTLPLRSSGETVHLKLAQKNIFSPDFIARTSDGQDITSQVLDSKHYRGIIDGVDNSLVSISVFRNEIIGFVSSSEGNFTLGRLRDSQTKHIVYEDATLRQAFEGGCTMEDDGVSYTTEELSYEYDSRDPGDCVNVYIEAGQSVYNSFGGNLTNTTNFLNGVFGQSYILYANDGVSMQTSELFIWTTPDPYTSGSTGGQLGEFQNQISSMNGDIGHLVEVQNIGGLAAGFSGICNSNIDNSLCFSGFSGNNYNNVPTTSFNVYIITHEMGHLLGSRHTHACVWNGNNTAIDSCSGFTEGSCPLPGSPPANQGTIMSYCINSVGLNFSEGFHPQPSAVISNTVDAAGNCLTSCVTCSLSIDCSGITNQTLACIDDLPAPNTSLVTVNSSCGSATITSDTATSSDTGCPGDPMIILRTYTVEDDDGNMLECEQVFTIISNALPVITCSLSDMDENLDANCEFVVPDYLSNISATAECGVATITQSPAPGTVISGTGANTITFEATDECGRVVDCSIVLTTMDVTLPEVFCQDITVSLDSSGQYTLDPLEIDNGSFDNCGIDQRVLSQSVFTCNDIGVQSVDLTIIDDNGNINICTALVTVIDNSLPTVICQDITLPLDASGNASISALDIDNGSNDACGVATTTINISSFDCSSIGTNIVTLTVTDVNGNVATCDATVTVVDTIAPEYDQSTLPDDQSREADSSGNYTLEDFTVGVSVTDNCSDPLLPLSIIQDPAIGTLLGIGVHDITLSAIDDEGNTTDHVFELTVTEEVLGVSENELSSLVLYPNPTSGILKIENPNSIDIEQIELFDITGRLVQSFNPSISENKITLNIQSLETATYLLVIRTDNSLITKQILKK